MKLSQKTLIATNGETGEDRMELWDGPLGKSILMPGGSWLHEGQIGYASALEYCDQPATATPPNTTNQHGPALTE